MVLAAKARSPQVQTNLVAHTAGGGIDEYISHLEEFFGVEELIKEPNPALQNIFVTVHTAGNGMKVW